VGSTEDDAAGVPDGDRRDGVGAPVEDLATVWSAPPPDRATDRAPPPAPGIPGVPAAEPPVPAAPPRRTHRWGLGAYVVVEVVFLGTSVLLGLFLAGDGPMTAGVLAVSLAAPSVLAAGTALLITRVRGNGPRIDLGLEWSWRDVGIGLAFGFGGLLITVPASILYVAIAGQDSTSAVGEVFDDVRAGPLLAVTVLLIVVVVAPVCEEIVYRGLLWGGVERLGAGRWGALGVTTVLFALAHFEFERTPLLLVVALPIAFARLYTNRLPASIVAHAVNNLLPGISLTLMLLGLLPTV